MVKSKGTGLRHLRRSSSPEFWPILRKEYVWTVNPSPGPHSKDRCIPIGIIIRDLLGYARTMREARRVLGEGKVKVDGRIVRDYKFPVGLMDVVEIVPSGETYRVVPHPVKHMVLHPIPKDEASFKLLRIEGKTIVKGRAVQLHFHDGRNHLLKDPSEDVFKTYDVVKMTIPKQEIIDHIKFEEGVLAVVIAGRNIGKVGRVVDVKKVFKTANALVTMESDGESFRTILDYVFVIGMEEPLITLPEYGGEKS